MDDALDPNLQPKPIASLDAIDDQEQHSDEDEDVPDWTKFAPSGANKPVIPKRGEKEFEPANHGSGLQQFRLEKARAAMIAAIDVQRVTSSRNISYGVWYPGLSRAHAVVPRGVHFGSMGYSVPRPVESAGPDIRHPQKLLQKRLELLPEEALYLVERGSMFCFLEDPSQNHEFDEQADVQGIPMSLQQAYTEMVGKDGLTLEKYQAYAYLRRMGYVITRAKPPDSFYPVAQACSRPATTSICRIYVLFEKLVQCIWQPLRALGRVLRPRGADCWQPLAIQRGFGSVLSYSSIFSVLRRRVTPPEHEPERHQAGNHETPYEIFYNVYKPSTPFRKTSPPAPDFSLVVIDARSTPVPSLQDFSALFDELPLLPPPVPRRRQPNPALKKPVQSNTSLAISQDVSLLSRILSSLAFWRPRAMLSQSPTPPQNPFPILKQGKKAVVIAVVDAGTLSFFRFGQGSFEEWPMI